MRNFLINLAAITLAASTLSCQQVADDSAESRSMTTIHIQASLFNENEISGWTSGDESDLTLNGQQVKSRAGEDAVSRMAFFLLDEDGNQTIAQELSNNEDGFMTLYAEVPTGTYELIAFGHNGSGNVSLTEEKEISPTGKLTDSFHHYQTLTLSEDSANSQSIVLNRCIAKFSIKHTDAIPTGTATVETTVTGGSNIMDATTGFAASAVNQTITINIPESAAGTKNNTFSFFTFLTEEESTIDVTATAKDKDGNTIVTHTFEDIEAEINMQTIYSGVFFHADHTTNITINSEWKDDKVVTF